MKHSGGGAMQGKVGGGSDDTKYDLRMVYELEILKNLRNSELLTKKKKEERKVTTRVSISRAKNVIVEGDFTMSKDVKVRMEKLCGATNFSLGLRNSEHAARYVTSF